MPTSCDDGGGALLCRQACLVETKKGRQGGQEGRVGRKKGRWAGSKNEWSLLWSNN
jgi:hypothetical protein